MCIKSYFRYPIFIIPNINDTQYIWYFWYMNLFLMPNRGHYYFCEIFYKLLQRRGISRVSLPCFYLWSKRTRFVFRDHQEITQVLSVSLWRNISRPPPFPLFSSSKTSGFWLPPNPPFVFKLFLRFNFEKKDKF